MRVPRQSEVGAAEVSKILFGIERHMRGGEVNITPGALYRMRGGEDSSAAHCDQRVDDADA